MFKNLLVITIFLFVLLFQVKAETLDRSVWKADDSIYKEVNSFAQKDYINIYLLPSNKSYIAGSCEVRIRDLYYYFVTRLGTDDIPAHFLVCPDGTIYQGAKQGVEKEFKYYERTSAIVIYLVLENFTDETSLQNFLNFLVDLASNNFIKPQNINFYGLYIETNQSTGSINFKGRLPNNDLILDKITDSLRLIKSNEKVYKLTLQKLTQSKSNPKPKEIVDVTLELKNESSTNIYPSVQNSVFLYLDPLIKTSLFYDKSWTSLNSIKLLTEGVFMKDELKTFTFKVSTPIQKGKVSQSFKLGMNPTVSFGLSFSIDLDIDTQALEIIQIMKTETGRLRVRDVPNGNNVVTYVYPNEKFIVEERQNGWIKITANDKIGWIAASYTRVI